MKAETVIKNFKNSEEIQGIFKNVGNYADYLELDQLSFSERAEQTWRSAPEIRTEFGNKESFAAYLEQWEAGNVPKIVGGTVKTYDQAPR